MGWCCSVCTLVNENDTFLACECCGGKRSDKSGEISQLSAPVPSSSAPERKDTPPVVKHSPLAPAPADPSSSAPNKQNAAHTSPPNRKRRLPREEPPSRRLPTNNHSLLSSLRRLPSNPVTVRSYPPNANANRPASCVAISDNEVRRHAPASLTRSVLPPALADRLLSLLHADGDHWHRGTWTVFGRSSPNARTNRTFDLASSPGGNNHSLGPVAIDAEERGTTADVHPSCPELLEAAGIIRDLVWRLHGSLGAVDWRPTFAFGNRYADGSEHVGFHSDFLLGLGPRPIIAGLSLGATRTFRLKKQATGEQDPTIVSIPAPHNSLIVMDADCQEKWHHSVVKVANSSVRSHGVSGTVRYSLTFRMDRPDFMAIARVDCDCGRAAALKCKNGSYYLTCNPAGGSASDKCSFYRRSEIAQREAERLRALDA